MNTNTSTIAGKNKIMTSMVWNSIQMLVNQLFVVIIRLALAKLLFPEQFGIVGMALVFTNMVQMLNDLGISAALIQKKEEELTEAHYQTAFWTGIGWSVLLFLFMIFLAAPFAAHFYNEPLLNTIIPVMSIGILINPINLVQQAQLTRSLDFKKIAAINSSATIIAGCISLILAFCGAGIWALIFNTVATYVLAMPLFLAATRWKPKMVWEKNAFKEVFGFGLYTTGTSLAGYAMNNADYFFIGRMLNAEMLGVYTLAFMLTDTFRSKLMTVMNNVMYPVYSQCQNNPAIIKKYYLKVIEYNSLTIYPIMLYFILFGHPLIIGIFGEKWAHTVIPLKILSVAVMLHMLVNSNTVLIRGLGKPGLEMKLQLFKAVLFIPTLAAGIHYYGITGAAWAVCINKFLAIVIAQFTFNKLLSIKISLKDFLDCLKTPLLATGITAIASLIFFNLGMHYLPGGFLLLFIYGIIAWSLKKEEFLKQLADLKKSKKQTSNEP